MFKRRMIGCFLGPCAGLSTDQAGKNELMSVNRDYFCTATFLYLLCDQNMNSCRLNFGDNFFSCIHQSIDVNGFHLLSFADFSFIFMLVISRIAVLSQKIVQLFFRHDLVCNSLLGNWSGNQH